MRRVVPPKFLVPRNSYSKRVVIYRKKSRLFHKSGCHFVLLTCDTKKSPEKLPDFFQQVGISESKNVLNGCKKTTLTCDESHKLRVTSEHCSEVTRSFCDSSKVRVVFFSFLDSQIPDLLQEVGQLLWDFFWCHMSKTKMSYPDL